MTKANNNLEKKSYSVTVRSNKDGYPKVGTNVAVVGSWEKRDPTFSAEHKRLVGRTGKVSGFREELLQRCVVVIVKFDDEEHDFWLEELQPLIL